MSPIWDTEAYRLVFIKLEQREVCSKQLRHAFKMKVQEPLFEDMWVDKTRMS